MLQMGSTLRTPWQVTVAAISALVIRDIRKRFILTIHTKRSIAFVKIFIEPALHIASWMFFRAHFTSSFTDNNFQLFILLGVVPYTLTRIFLIGSVRIIKSNRDILVFKQIIPADLLISSFLAETAVMSSVLCFFLFSLYCLGYSVYFKNPIEFLIATLLWGCFLAGLGLIFAVIGFLFSYFKLIIIGFTRILYLLSGVFFSLEAIPLDKQWYISINPLFQLICIWRRSFIENSGYQGDIIYLAQCSLVSLFLGLVVYHLTKNKIMIDIMQR